MASLEKRGNAFRIVFRHQGIKYARSLETTEERAAKSALARLEDMLHRVQIGAVLVPPGTNFVEFLLSDGRAQPQAKPGVLTLASLFSNYFAKLPDGNLESSTIRTMEIHQKQLERHFGKSFVIDGLTTTDLQGYIEKRSKDPGRKGRKVTPTTIKKAIITLRTVWNWGRQHKLIIQPYPSRGLKYPKGDEKPPFMTFAEVEKRVKRLSEADAADLWECVFLSLAEIDDLLKFVKQNARHPFLYPMFVFAAHTGARRSEILRSKLTDLDFESNLITIHERKKSHDKRTTRQVPMSPLLREALLEWLKVHFGGSYTFTQGLKVFKSRKQRTECAPLTINEAHHHFRRTLEGAKWETLRGWHVFRHSFCSNCAAKGIDQRIIDDWVGHLSEDMVRRYRHLLPDQRQQAIKRVFTAIA